MIKAPLLKEKLAAQGFQYERVQIILVSQVKYDNCVVPDNSNDGKEDETFLSQISFKNFAEKSSVE